MKKFAAALALTVFVLPGSAAAADRVKFVDDGGFATLTAWFLGQVDSAVALYSNLKVKKVKKVKKPKSNDFMGHDGSSDFMGHDGSSDLTTTGVTINGLGHDGSND